MASDIGVGDVESPYVDVAPADNTTVATLTVHKPDGTSTTVPASGGALTPIPDTSPVQYSQRWTADTPVTYDQASRWVLHWDVTGTGESDEDLEVWVVASPVAGGPTWTPGRTRVAAYVPGRTLERNPATTGEGEDVHDLTFTSNTRPTGLAVDRLIADGLAWVTSRVTPMNTAVQDAAAVVVALYAAAAVERGAPEGDDSLQRANDLEKRLDILLKDLIAANNAANGTDDYGLEVVPMWSYPPADPRWDCPTYW